MPSGSPAARSDRPGHGHSPARTIELGRMPTPHWRGTACSFRCCCARPVFIPAGILCGSSAPKHWPEAVAGLPGAGLTAIQYLDSRGADGKVRKYRVMMIDGRLYPLHLAISSHWKIHYFTAEMAERAEHRAEDAEFLENMPGVLGPRAMAALEQIQAALGLDYAGIDFGLSAGRRPAAVRGQCHHGGQPARARRALGLPPARRGTDFRRRPQNAAGESREVTGHGRAVCSDRSCDVDILTLHSLIYP